MVCDGLVGKVLYSFKAVGSIDDQETQEDGEGDSVSHKLHEGASQDLTKLEVKKFRNFQCVYYSNASNIKNQLW